MRLLRCIFAFAFACLIAPAQSYIYDAGSPAYGVNVPVENGFINISNGNLHLDFSLAQHPQRGNLKLNERLVYDSHFWKIGHYSNYYWWPDNVTRTDKLAAGWRFVSGGETGLLFTNAYYDGETNCYDRGNVPGAHNELYRMSWNWTDPGGAVHPFDAMYSYNEGDCDLEPAYPETQTGTATDASGYTLTAVGSTNSASPAVTIRDNNGNQVYPSVADRYGNFWTTDSSGNLIDDRGQTPVVVSYSGNQIYYDVLGQGGGRARYTVTTVHLTPHTQFNQQGGLVREYPDGNNEQNLNAVQTLQLPDGSTYTFDYENTFGMMTGITLPSGGHVAYGWTKYTDSYNNVNQWLTSRTVGSDPASTFTPSVISACGSNQQNCHEQVVVHEPGGDDTVYDLQLNNGAWNTSTRRYSGPASGGTPLTSTETTYDFSSPCGSICNGSAYITAQTVTTRLEDTGVKRSDTYEYANNRLGLLSAKKVYDFYTGSLPAQPMQQTQYTYAGTGIPGDVSRIMQTDGAGNPISFKQFTYTNSAQPTSNLAGHDISRSLGIYLQSVADWVSTDGSYITTNLTMDDAGTLQTESLSAGGITYGATTLTADGSDTFNTGVSMPTVNGLALTSGTTPDATTGVPLSTTDSNGKSTTYSQYDSLNRFNAINYPNGGSTTFVRSPNILFTFTARNASQTAVSGNVYDEFGRQSRAVTLNGQSTNGWYLAHTCYNSNGQISYQSMPFAASGWDAVKNCSGSGTSYVYDAFGRPSNITTADGSTLYSYGGRATRMTDVNGKQIVSQIDGLGRLTAVCEVTAQTVPGGTPQACGLDIAATGYLTTYTYDDVNHRTTVTQGQQTRVFQSDSLGRPTYTAEPERGETTYVYSYNATGPVTTRTRSRANVGDPNLKTRTMTQFDALNRPVSVTYTNNDGSAASFTNNKHFYYDGNAPSGFSAVPANAHGLLSGTSTDANSRSWYSYDEVGHVTEMRQCAPSTCASAAESRPSLSFNYDYLGDLTSYFDGASGYIAYTRSPAGEITSVTNQTYTDAPNTPNLITNVVNGPFGPTNWNLGNGTSVVHSYDTMGRLHGGWLCAGNGGQGTSQFCNGTAQLHGFFADHHGDRVTGMCDTVMNQCQSHIYDDLGRLVGVSGNASWNTSFTYSYDRWGNRLNQSGSPSVSFNVDPATNRLPFVYDVAGNQVTDATSFYVFDGEGKVVEFHRGSDVTYYTYDAMDNRVRVRSVSGRDTEYMYDPFGRRQSSWNVSNNFGNEGRIYWDGGMLGNRSYNGTTYFHAADWLGTERLRTDWQGQLANAMRSWAFGDGFSQDSGDTAGPAQNNNEFAGTEYDAESGTDHATYRQYAPVEAGIGLDKHRISSKRSALERFSPRCSASVNSRNRKVKSTQLPP